MSSPKPGLHKRNKNTARYDLDAMAEVSPDLSKHIVIKKDGGKTIDFSSQGAVRSLNKAILHHYYGVNYWEFPEESLTPGIPGRAEYVHTVADLLAESNDGVIPRGADVTVVDVGVGASCVYPVIGVVEYDWNFIGSDVDAKSLEFCNNIINQNDSLKGKIECRQQADADKIFVGILVKKDKVFATICNPPFHASIEDAVKASRRKVRNLNKQKVDDAKLNFSGKYSELVYEGGELNFILKMIYESVEYKNQCYWFTSLVSREENLGKLNYALDQVKAIKRKTVSIKTGNKMGRIVAWSFFSSGLGEY